ncbi:hypothetical protein DRQ27_03870 [bacterium]|nr:MAG: hypothetical protein DRQ27_03870 [bacterium]
MRDDIFEKLIHAKNKIDGFGEIRFQRSKSLVIRFRNGRAEMINPTVDQGGCVRALLAGHGFGFANFNSLDGLINAVSDATDASRALIPDEPIKLAEIEPVEVSIEAKLKDDFRSHTLEEKVDLLKSYDEILAGYDKRIIERTLIYTEEFIENFLVTTDGVRIYKQRADGVLVCVVRATDGKTVQSAHKSYATRHSFSELARKHDLVEEVAKIAVGLVEAEPIKGGKYTVVVHPSLAGVFIHEAFGHLSEADHIEENPQAREMMKLGRKFGPEFLNVIDDGSVVPEIRGTIFYDDEGVPAQKTYLIKDGVLVGRLHSRKTAASMGEKPTGNARAQDYNFQPIVRMTNTAIEAGPHPADQIFDGIKLGVYVIDAYGGQTELENFSFSAGHAYMIRDGKVAEMVRDVVLQGNLFETLANIEQIADDFVWCPMGGYCGKGGQRAKTAEGAPHIRIRNVLIGGK